MSNKIWVLNVTYPVNLDASTGEWFPLDEPLEKALGNSAGSGCGFGERDIDFEFDTKKAALAAKKLAKQVAAAHGLKLSCTSVYDMILDDEDDQPLT